LSMIIQWTLHTWFFTFNFNFLSPSITPTVTPVTHQLFLLLLLFWNLSSFYFFWTFIIFFVNFYKTCTLNIFFLVWLWTFMQTCWNLNVEKIL
jgi:hypothetical protein